MNPNYLPHLMISSAVRHAIHQPHSPTLTNWLASNWEHLGEHTTSIIQRDITETDQHQRQHWPDDNTIHADWLTLAARTPSTSPYDPQALEYPMELVVAAFRYCLGRQTYIVSECTSWLTHVWQHLDEATRTLITSETQEALRKGTAGNPNIDEPAWQQLLSSTTKTS